ncbi:GDSL-type esterase/lipase family protein [Cnuibacter sp. UC19_7]|uniref:GDSL-type esterase/lipase family protein n=1 Tax=Cnuibacter sp. UC19_7 TaxID=3350166 RepID=UPI00366B7B1E
MGILDAPPIDATGRALSTFPVAPLYALPRGGKTIILGDSLIATNETSGASITRSDSSAAHMGFASSGKLWNAYNAGIAGNTSAQMLARFDTDVLAYKPGICVIAAGTNDARTGVTLATYITNIKAIVAKCFAAGIFPAIRTVPPCYDTAGSGGEAAVRQRISSYNAWIREWAPTLGIPVIDVFSEFVDPTNGRIKTAYAYGDGIHFLVDGYAKQGQMIAAALAPYIGAALPYLATDAGDPTDLLSGTGLFLGAPAGNGLPAGWSTGDAAHATFSVAASPDGFGKELTLTAVGDVAYQVQAYRFVNTGVAAGDVVEVGGVLSSTQASGHTAAVSIAFQGSPAAPASITRQTNITLTGGSFYERFTVPSGTVGGFLLRIYAGPSAGTAKFRRLRVRNLTALGIATV